jgi:hypothetical protein
MTGEELRLDAPRAERAGNALGQAAADLTRLRVGIGAELDVIGEQRPWGRDDLGSAFQQNYEKYAPQLLKAWADIAAYVDGLSEKVVDAVHTTLDSDADSGRRSDRI